MNNMIKYAKDYRKYITLPNIKRKIQNLKNKIEGMSLVYPIKDYPIEEIEKERSNLSNLIKTFNSLGVDTLK